MGKLIWAELFKIRKRRMSFVLLGALISSFLLIFFLHYRAVGGSSAASEAAHPLIFPQVFELIFNTASGIGTLLLVILASFVVGEEYGWGTIGKVMTGVVVRHRYLGAKVGSLFIVALAISLISLVLGISLGFVTTTHFSEVNLDFVTLSLVGKVGRMLGGTVLVLMANALLALMFVILTRSAWWGIGGYILYGFLEMVITVNSLWTGGWISHLPQYLITPSANSILQLEENASTWLLYSTIPHATAVLLAWCLLLFGMSFYLFRRQDITV
jgi:ABC-type transport system involved in multi-copper enzyme maturation permease subunit